jgi:hypothetical protein
MGLGEGYFKIEEENVEKGRCNFCKEEKLCIYWFDCDDQTEHICVDCANKLKNIFNKQLETHECVYTYKNGGFFCSLCHKPAKANEELVWVD